MCVVCGICVYVNVYGESVCGLCMYVSVCGVCGMCVMYVYEWYMYVSIYVMYRYGLCGVVCVCVRKIGV